MLQDEKAAALLIGSDKMYGLLNMTTLSREYQRQCCRRPFWRARTTCCSGSCKRPAPVQMEVNIQGALGGKPVEVYNTRGGDSRNGEAGRGGDPRRASGLVGSGNRSDGQWHRINAVLEAARALQKLGVKPKRTIRFVLFTGEEPGLNGSRAYVASAQDELPKDFRGVSTRHGHRKGATRSIDGELQRAGDDWTGDVSLAETRGNHGTHAAQRGRIGPRTV